MTDESIATNAGNRKKRAGKPGNGAAIMTRTPQSVVLQAASGCHFGEKARAEDFGYFAAALADDICDLMSGINNPEAPLTEKGITDRLDRLWGRCHAVAVAFGQGREDAMADAPSAEVTS